MTSEVTVRMLEN